jgi:inhibitor of KinA sporulation pathway (predicted exonuclease)/pSer/pThr/pTyr-binding forkhead associated (FHA) protein
MERKPDPRWATMPPEDVTVSIEVYKSGELVDTHRLCGQGIERKPAFLFGRTPVCDFVLEHASISRQHAFIGWDHTGALLITDSSAHGTSVNRTTAVPSGGVAAKLKDGDTIAFGASSRSYVVSSRTKAEIEAAAAAEEEARAAPPQPFQRLCALQLVTTCGENGETSGSATFLGPPEVVRLSAVLLDTRRPMRPGAPPRLLGEFDELARPSMNPLLSEFCLRLAGTTQDSVDAAQPLRDVLTSFISWLDEHGCFGEAAATDETEKAQKPVMVVTLGESNLKRHLPRECLELQIKLPPMLQDWVQLRTLFNCHTGLQKLSKAERRGATGDDGDLKGAAEAEAHQMLTMLDAAAAQSGAEVADVPSSAVAGAAGLVATVVSRLVADGCIVSHAAITAKAAAAKAVRKAVSDKPKSRWDDDDDDGDDGGDDGGDDDAAKRRRLH